MLFSSQLLLVWWDGPTHIYDRCETAQATFVPHDKLST